MRALLIACGIAAAVACIAVANLVLLGYGNRRHDPVGNLNPVARLPTVLPATTVEPPARTDSRDD